MSGVLRLFRCRGLLLIATLFGATHVLFSQQKEKDDLAAKVATIVSSVVEGEAQLKESYGNRAVLHAAGNAGLQQMKPDLRVIADREVTDVMLNFSAQAALWTLGEDESYFLDLIESDDRTSAQKANAVWVLARRPTPTTDAVIRRLNPDPRDNRLSGAIDTYFYARSQMQKYSNLTRLNERISFLLLHASRGYYPVGVDPLDLNSAQYPTVVWSKAELLELSKQYPDEVARSAWNHRERSADHFGGGIPSSYDLFLADLFAAESREVFREYLEAR